MATKEIHLRKYRKNKKLAANGLLCKEENNDWRTVIIYYAALHIIDSTYADSVFHPKSHEKRKEFIEKVPRYDAIIDIYNNLEMLSRKARYDSLNIKPKEVTDALICLGKIEKHFNVS